MLRIRIGRLLTRIRPKTKNSVREEGGQKLML